MSRLPRIAAERRGRRIAVLALLALGQAAATGAIAFAMRDVFAAFGEAGDPLPAAALATVAGGAIAIAILRGAEHVLGDRLGHDYAAALRLRLFEHVARMPARVVAGRRSGALSLRFVGDLAAVRGWISLGVARLISAAIVLPLTLVVLVLLDPRLAAAAAVPLGLCLVLMAAAGAALGPLHRRLRARRARLAADVSERLPHGPELRLLGRVATERRLITRRTERLADASAARARGLAMLRGVPDIASGITGATILLVSLRGDIPAGTAAGALAALGIAAQTLRDLATAWDRHRAWAEARGKCEALLAEPRLAASGRGQPAERPGDAPPAIRFRRAGSAQLRGIDAEAEPGRRIAVLGASGAGKSTLLALAAGLEAPSRGRVRVGGVAPTSLTAAERRRMVHLVGPRSPILAGSLRRALTMGAAVAHDDAAVEAVARKFGLAPVLVRLGGLDGRVGEGARTLSAGERKRLLLARAALSGAHLLLLDEPDETLGSEGPALVARLLAGTKATCLVATHSPAVAAMLDGAWFLDAGRLVEAGEMTELARADGPTSRFLQAREAA